METVFYKTDRTLYPWYLKYPPFVVAALGWWFFGWWGALLALPCAYWWFLNDEAKPTDSFYYLYLRNPLSNGTRFCLGVADRSHWVTGTMPALTNLPSDLGHSGIRWSVIWLGPIPALPYVAWSILDKWDFYLGWLPWGQFGLRSTGPWAKYIHGGIGAAAGLLWWWWRR